MGIRAAIYLRVSKGELHTDNQRPDVERVIATRQLEIVAEYEEKEKASAAKVRPVFDKIRCDENSFHETTDKGHGRLEVRRVSVLR